jgi:hypothetical protein
MEDISKYRLVLRTLSDENTLAENSMLKKDNKFLITTTILLWVVAIGLLAYSIDQELQKK